MLNKSPSVFMIGVLLLLISALVLSSCSSTQEQAIQVLGDNPLPRSTYSESIPTPLPADTSQENITLINPVVVAADPVTMQEPTNTNKPPTAPVVITPTPLPPDYWMTLPIIPQVSQTARDIYQRGIAMGRDPHAFSKIGDCQNITTYFLSYFELPEYYDLGDYAYLQETLDWYSGSFSRESQAVKGGFNAAAILSPLRADPKQCKSDENPIACELRLNNPSLAIISLEEWWAGHPENYEKYMRQIIEYTIDQGVVPIVATKADNLEGDHSINQTIARLAFEYDIPLWNFWLAVQPLPGHGLIAFDANGAPDLFHLTHGNNFYFTNDTSTEQSGWSVRNLTALQVLDSIRRELNNPPNP